jgi:hypothetical protein
MAEKEVFELLNTVLKKMEDIPEIKQQVALTHQSVEAGIFPRIKRYEELLDKLIDTNTNQNVIIAELKTKSSGIQNELTEHKDNHFENTKTRENKEHREGHYKFAGILLTVVTIIITTGGIIIGVMIQKGG